jgi:hypothetical protein
MASCLHPLRTRSVTSVIGSADIRKQHPSVQVRVALCSRLKTNYLRQFIGHSSRQCTERCTEGSALPTFTKRTSEVLRVTWPKRHHPESEALFINGEQGRIAHPDNLQAGGPRFEPATAHQFQPLQWWDVARSIVFSCPKNLPNHPSPNRLRTHGAVGPNCRSNIHQFVGHLGHDLSQLKRLDSVSARLIRGYSGSTWESIPKDSHAPN